MVAFDFGWRAWDCQDVTAHVHAWCPQLATWLLTSLVRSAPTCSFLALTGF